MNQDPAVQDIRESVLRLFPDRLGGTLSIQELAQYLRTVHGGSGGSEKSSYEVVRRALPDMGIPVSIIPGLGKRIWVSHLVEALAKLRDPEPIVPAASKKKGGFGKHPIDYGSNRGRNGGHGGVVASPLFVTVGGVMKANPDAWQLLPAEQLPIAAVRTEFVSELAAIRYAKRRERSQAFWNELDIELSRLLAEDRHARATEGPALKNSGPSRVNIRT